MSRPLTVNRYKNRVALVTAGGSGLGLGVATRLAKEEAVVIIWDRDERAMALAREALSALGVEVQMATINMLNSRDIRRRVNAIIEELGRIDVLVNNIGGSLHTPFHFLEQTHEDWKRVMDINVTACVDVTREVIPHMMKNRYGRIINMGSKAGRYGSLFAGANYTASKGAMQAFTLQIAQEFGPEGITCNTVCPGAILTPRVQSLLTERQSIEEQARVVSSIPVRRNGKVEDVAAAVAFLASEEASFINGASLDVNGGQRMSI